MGVDDEQLVYAYRLDELGDHFRADCFADVIATVLTRVSEIGHDRRDASRPGSLACIGEHDKLDNVLVNGRAGGLDDEHVPALLRASEDDVELAVGKALEGSLFGVDPARVRNGIHQPPVAG